PPCLLYAGNQGLPDAGCGCRRLKCHAAGNANPPFSLESTVALRLVHTARGKGKIENLAVAPDLELQRPPVRRLYTLLELLKGKDGSNVNALDHVTRL